MHLIRYTHRTIRFISIDWLIDWLAIMFEPLTSQCTYALKTGSRVPHNLIPVQGSPVSLLKFQMTPRFKLLMPSGSRKKEPRYTCQSEDKASHSQRMWAEVSSTAPHLLHKGLLVSPIKWRCFLRVLCPVSWAITTLDCVLLKEKFLLFAAGRGAEINSRACPSMFIH